MRPLRRGSSRSRLRPRAVEASAPDLVEPIVAALLDALDPGAPVELMEAYFTQFVKDWRIQVPKGLGKLKVCLYSNYDDMVQIGGAGGGVLGYFRFVPPLELNFFHD